MKLQKCVSNVVWGLILFIMAVTAVSLLSGIKPAIVLSGSMEPEIPTGSLCLINTDADIDEIQEGDIIAFTSGTMAVTHRVLTVTEEGFQTKGDANDAPDLGIVPKQNVTGKTVFWIPYAGYLADKAGTVPGKILMGVILAISILAGFLEKEPKQKKKSSCGQRCFAGRKKERNKP